MKRRSFTKILAVTAASGGAASTAAITEEQLPEGKEALSPPTLDNTNGVVIFHRWQHVVKGSYRPDAPPVSLKIRVQKLPIKS